MKFSKIAQISIFIILAIIILALFIYLFSGIFDNKKKEIKEGETITLDQNKKLDTLKQKIDYCLEKELYRALIIAGLRGGFLYDKNEYYFPSIIPDKTYSNELLSNLNLNRNNLLSQVLVSSHYMVYSPMDTLNFYNSSYFYNHSIKDDFEKFILAGFISCVNIFELEELGYEININEYSGKLLEIHPDTIYANELKASLGDEILLLAGSESFFGHISKINKDYFEVKFEEEYFKDKIFEVAFEEIKIINTNMISNLNVDFQDEYVQVNFQFPSLIVSGEFESVYKNINQIAPVRFKKLLELSNLYLNDNYYWKRLDNDYNQRFNNVLNSNTYFLKSPYQNISLKRTDLLDLPEEKKYVYSIIDRDSKIYGSPYVFNFAYENSAPFINISKSPFTLSEDEKVLFATSKGKKFTFDLKNITSDKQWFDNFNSYFIEYSYLGTDAHFSITSDGIISFTGFIEKRFSFEVSISDNETIRTQTFVFITGYPDNTNNSETFNCFLFKNSEIEGFPIVDYLKDTLFLDDTKTPNEVFGFFLSPLISLGIINNSLIFSSSCYFGDTYDMEIIAVDLESGTKIADLSLENGVIKLPQYSKSYQVIVSIISPLIGLPITEPFVITLEAANCLGPYSVNPDEQRFVFGDYVNNGNSGLSCCNIESLISGIESNNYKPYLNSILINDARTVLDASFHFCIDPEPKSSSQYAFDYLNEIIWDVYPQATSILGAHIKSICKGIFPNPIPENILEITSIGSEGNVVRNIQRFVILGNEYESLLGVDNLFNFGIVRKAKTCEFCVLNAKLSPISLIDSDNIYYHSSLENSLNEIISLEDKDSTQVLCSPIQTQVITCSNGINDVIGEIKIKKFCSDEPICNDDNIFCTPVCPAGFSGLVDTYPLICQ